MLYQLLAIDSRQLRVLAVLHARRGDNMLSEQCSEAL